MDGQEGQKGSEPENLTDQGREILPPPSEIADLDPHPSRLYSTFRGQRNEERGTMELKNRRMQSIVRDDGCMATIGKREECRME